MKIHFIGVGGIGVSSLAQYYLTKGYEVSGSDLALSETTEFLAKKGVKIFEGNSEKNVAGDIDLVIYSPAIKYDNPEFRKARETGAKMQSYPEALGELTKEFYTIAVSGSHGKSTTTSMLGLLLVKAGIDPTVIVGTKLKEFGNSNFRAGKSKILVIEACEYDSSFLNYTPKIIVVTNVDKEHLDYFKNFNNVKKAFKDFVSVLPEDGIFVFNKDDKATAVIPAKAEIQSVGKKPGFRVKPGMTRRAIGYSTKQKDTSKLKKILKVPGMHNVSNALAVLTVAREMDIPDKVSFKALSEFQGTWRRFEIKKGRAGKKNITVVSDYGHHPSEVLATLKAAREKYASKSIWCIFQPHQKQRIYYLFNDFVKLFKTIKIDNIIITDIYDVAGREVKDISDEVSSEKLVKKINKKNVAYMPITDAETFVKDNIKSGDILIIMGAGSIYKLVDKF
jgi:UDP-N-acetylmuramate--alanine ligase